ncbi:43 kDa receptor-associated protein of the synapse-like [Branchiostoma floridae]|uniref:43 kDa receptor-associated protein of the synapse-like n=1 Tax=Branchiostoma floridae TaxID=7739 RepID=C3ZW56_BRAFL|nr:43 kDa receptor-associated protein of the synapse-like [Branchiostoma floridae]|eukprot:XP_002587259.1 hypothetical protein BRAFLDRAFT_116065 [Branchiostoma floridae]
MGQRAVKQHVEEGLKHYDAHNIDAAITKWTKTLPKITEPRLKFRTLGYLASAWDEVGKYREMLKASIQQIDVANSMDADEFREEAYLNIARSNERLCEYEKAIAYCKHSLNNAFVGRRRKHTFGRFYHCMANAHLGLSEFCTALEHFENALSYSQTYDDRVLECRTFLSVGGLFYQLRDYERSQYFYGKAREILGDYGARWSWKMETVCSLNIAMAQRKMGRLTEAMESCEDAMKIALHQGDRPSQAECLRCFADIHRNRGDIERAYPRYEASLNIMVETGDRYGQVQVLSGMAKVLVMNKQFEKGMEMNKKALELALAIGNKLSLLRAHFRLEMLYRSLGDFQQMREHVVKYTQALEAMELYCGACGDTYGEKPDRIEALPCSHIFHSRCVETTLQKTTGCPDCRRVMLRPVYV